jgi:hypothetical protein
VSLTAALAQLRAGQEADAETSAGALVGFARMRFDMALAYKRGERARARELAAQLWHACAVDPTVMAILVDLDHPELRESAAELLRRFASDIACDVTAAWHQLETHPDDLDAWRDVISYLIVTGRAVEAVSGVARALSERVADFSLWARLATLQLTYRQRAGLLATIELGRRAFPRAPDMHATAAMILVGLGDLTAARDELAAIGEVVSDSPVVLAARSMLGSVE